MIQVTVITCYQTGPGLYSVGFLDPAAMQSRTVRLNDHRTAWALAKRLEKSGNWQVTPSLSRGLWRAVRISLLDKNVPDWREKVLANAEANRR